MSIESTVIAQRVQQDKRERRRFIFKAVTQSIVIAAAIQIVALFISSLIVVLAGVGSYPWTAFINSMVTMIITVFGLWVLALWLDIK